MQRLRIKEIAEAKGFSRARLERETGIDIKIIRELYDNPDYNPELNTLRKVAKALAVSMRDLFEEESDDQGE